MLKRIIIRNCLILTIIIFITDANAQSKYSKAIFSNYILTLNLGPSMVITEYEKDLSGIINEMNHRPNISYSIQLTKVFSKNWEIGYQYESCYFSGFQNNPDFSAYHFGHYSISEMRIEPVKYNSRIINNNLILKYNFQAKKDKRVVPFVFIKGGMTRLFSTLKYKANNEIIFQKTGRDENKPKASIYIDNFNIGIGVGSELVLSEKMGLTISFTCSKINDDNLDGVHNFNSPPPEGYINFVSGLYGNLTLGFSYNLNPDKERKSLRKKIIKDSIESKIKKRRNYLWFKKN